MTAYNKLSDYAVQNIWCAPGMDSQFIVRAERIARPGGFWNSVTLLWRQIQLPLPKVRFQVYRLGRIPPAILGLLNVGETWTKISDTMQQNSLIVDLYNQYGVEYARSATWYQVLEDNTILLAVQSIAKIPVNLDQEHLYIRFYTNRLNYPGQLDVYVECEGRQTYSTQDVLDIQDAIAAMRQRQGMVYGFINGRYVPDITLINAAPGDYVEYVYDSSVYRIVDLAVRDLPTFTSAKDMCNKFLLNYPGNTLEIDYHDDIDIWLINANQTGVYYHRNNPSAVRMVTHKDYSVPVSSLQDYVNKLDLFGQNVENMTLRLHIRKPSHARKLVYENNRIHELYKLPPVKIKEALLGINSVVENWQAGVLENSPYTSIMAQDSSVVDSKLVEQALGYNAISRALFDTPSATFQQSGQTVAKLPYGLMSRSTGYEFDSNGKLLMTNQHIDGSTYVAAHAKAALVEVIAGYPTQMLDDTYGQQTASIDPTLDYRFYTCDIIDGVPQNNWKDVTGSSIYAIVDGVCTWFTDPTKTYTLVRSNLSFLGYSVTLPANASILQLTLTQTGYRNNQFANFNMQVPLGELRLWMNDGRELIEGLDYIVKFPKILIINKSYLNNPKNLPQTVRIRFTGLADNMQRQSLGDVGFVEYGALSRNSRYDIRDDKVLHIVVDGCYYDRSQLVFSEDNPALVAIDARNGAPYQISDIVTPLRGLTSQDTYAMRAASMVIDQRVSDYNSQYVKDQTESTPSVIDSMHVVYSPFCHKLLMDLVSGVLTDPRLKNQYGDDTVRDICKPYLWLLDYDPTQDANLPNLNYVVIHPHALPNVVALDAYSYKFVEYAIRLYLKNRVTLSGFASITL